MMGLLQPITTSRQKHAAYGTDYGDEYQHVLQRRSIWHRGYASAGLFISAWRGAEHQAAQIEYEQKHGRINLPHKSS
jgi:hypothetical protein